jgi:tRNA-binding EMAP/Myf-like protein
MFGILATQVARIVSAEPLENSAKLLKLQADLGGGDTRQVMAGEAQCCYVV